MQSLENQNDCSTSCHSLHDLRIVEYRQIYAYHKKKFIVLTNAQQTPEPLQLSNQTWFSICFGYFDLDPRKEQKSKVKYLFLAIQDNSMADYWFTD